MSKSVEFVPGAKPFTTRIVMTSRNSAGRIAERRQFTVSDYELETALRKAGLFETKVVREPAPPQAAQLELANEIAWYQAQIDRTGGTPSAAAIVRQLWTRINEKLGLS